MEKPALLQILVIIILIIAIVFYSLYSGRPEAIYIGLGILLGMLSLALLRNIGLNV